MARCDWKMMICTHAMTVKHAQMHVVVVMMNMVETIVAASDGLYDLQTVARQQTFRKSLAVAVLLSSLVENYAPIRVTHSDVVDGHEQTLLDQ